MCTHYQNRWISQPSPVVSSKLGSFWCTKGVRCTAASHGTKMSLAQNHVYIRATGTVQKAEFEHTLDATKSEGNLDDWLDDKRSTIQWRSIFKTHEERSYDVYCDGSSDLWTEINHGIGDFHNHGVNSLDGQDQSPARSWQPKYERPLIPILNYEMYNLSQCHSVCLRARVLFRLLRMTPAKKLSHSYTLSMTYQYVTPYVPK